MNRYPLWKYLLILAIVIPGFLYALPNLFGEDPAVQVSGQRTSKVDAAVEARIEGALKKAGLGTKSGLLQNNRLQFRFHDTEAQLKARDLIQKELGDNYT
ncbi:MAG: protein translocase subunit SecD, partial [Gammaproteobacteria bacterium]